MPAEEQEQHAARRRDRALGDTGGQNAAADDGEARAEGVAQNAAGGDCCVAWVDERKGACGCGVSVVWVLWLYPSLLPTHVYIVYTNSHSRTAIGVLGRRQRDGRDL